MCLLGEDQISGRGGEKQLLRGTDGPGDSFRTADRVGKSSFLIFLPGGRASALVVVLENTVIPSSSLGLRNPPRPLLVASPASTGSSDSDGGLFCCPSNVAAQQPAWKALLSQQGDRAAFRRHLDSISVSGLPFPHPTPGCQAARCGQGALSPALSSPQMQSDFFLPKPRKLRGLQHLRKPLVVQVSTPPTCAPLEAWPVRWPGCSEAQAGVFLGLRFTM